MLDNTAVGHRYIFDNFGSDALPQATWQIDPFGHSAFQGILSSSRGGFSGVMWAREAAEFKAHCANTSKLERVWLPSSSLGGAVATFQGTFFDKNYASPPEASRCTNHAQLTTNATCNRALGLADAGGLISDVLTARQAAFRGDDILLNFGGDFTWENAQSVTGENLGNAFDYVDALIEVMNGLPGNPFNASYSTAADYINAKSTATALPVFDGDFFPYNDDAAGNNMWSGYFSSRPAFKGFVRESSALQLAARQLQVIVGGVTDAGPSNDLFLLERALGVAQHHDSITGTAKQVVDFDYERILELGRASAFQSVAMSISKATRAAGPWAVCELANVTICPSLEAGAPTVVVIHNALGRAVADVPIKLPVGMSPGVSSWSAFNSSGEELVTQLVPPSPRDEALRALYNGSSTRVQWLYFLAVLPPAGFSTVFLVPSAAAPSLLSHSSPPTPLVADGSITNGRVTINISAATGFMSAYSDALSGTSLPVSQTWRVYRGANGTEQNGSKQASGAYIFRPDASETAAAIAGTPTVSIVRGPIVSEAWTTLGYVTQVTRLFAGAADVELEWTVGPVDVLVDGKNESQEVISRFETPLSTAGTWVTDSNCHEGQVRQRGLRRNWTVALSEPVSGNYVPVNCLVRTSSPSTTLAIGVDRSHGTSSLADGSLEVMVHRRMVHDDGRGVDEALNEPGLDGKGLIVRGRHWLIAAPADTAAAAYKPLHLRGLTLPSSTIAFAPLVGTPAEWLKTFTPTASLLSASLPPALHLATVHALNATTILLRLTHAFDAGEHATLSAPVSIDLATLLLAPLRIIAAIEMTLPGSMPLASVPTRTLRTDGGAVFVTPAIPPPPAGASLTVTLTPGDVRTWECTLA